MTRNIKRLKILTIGAACAVLTLSATPGSMHAQTPAQAYTARGIATVSDDTPAAARARALTDAQQKAVLAALTDRLSMETLSRYFVSLHNLFISRPDVYVQRFRIINETALLNSYQIQIEAFVEEDLLDRDIESIGVYGPAKTKLQALLMVAESLSSEDRYARWWAANPAERTTPHDVGEQLAIFFRERGAGVVDHSSIPIESLAPVADEVFPDREAIFAAARQAGADTVMLAKASLKHTDGQPRSSFAQVQCDLSADVLDVRTGELMLQTATHALGVHIDQEAAAQDAVARACAHLVEQILDRLFLKIRATHAFSFRCTFADGLQKTSVQNFFSALRAAFPEIIRLDVRDTAEAHVRIANIVSSLDSAELAQKALQADLSGYRLTLGVVEDSIINIAVAATEATHD